MGIVSSYIEHNYVYSDIALLIDTDNHSFAQLLNSVLAIHRTAISHTAMHVCNKKTLNFCFRKHKAPGKSLMTNTASTQLDFLCAIIVT